MSYNDNITRIFEKLDKQTDLLHKVDTNIAELKQQSENINKRVKDLEEKSINDHERISGLETTVKLLKNNYKWLCFVFSAIGSGLAFLIANIGNILTIFKH